MTSGALAASWERDDLPRMPLGERLVYMELRYLSDRKGTLRLSQSDLANKLGVTRQAIVKHVDALISKRLVKRVGHGRYAVYADPMSLERVTLDYIKGLAEGDKALSEDVERLFYGDVLPYADSPGYDDRNDAITEALMACHRHGLLHFDEYTSDLTRTAKPI